MKKKLKRKIQAMAEGGHKLALIRQQLAAMVRPGVSLMEIELQAQKWLLETGGQPAFQFVKDYKWATCININEGVVHGVPNNYRIQNGDLVSIDVGLFYQDYYTDTAITIVAGQMNETQQRLLETGKLALKQALAAVKPGNHVGHISQTIQQVIEGAGYTVVKGLTGHGVGEGLHQPPNIPGFLIGDPKNSPILKLGQTLAVEIIYAIGGPDIVTEVDGWTISTQDGKMSALFEETVAVTEEGPLVLTE